MYKLAAILTLTLTLTFALTLQHLGADMIRSVNMRGAALAMTLLPATHDDVEPEREPQEVLHPESDYPAPTPLAHLLSAVVCL